MMACCTIDAWLTTAVQQLTAAGIGTARLDALVLLEDSTKRNRAHVLAHSEQELTDEQLKTLNTALGRRLQHEPLAYIRHKTEFYGREFYVDGRVLEPRPESETMIDLLKTLPATTICDVGTGSGALGITAKLELPAAAVTLLELDENALQVARQNAAKHQLQVTFLQNDLLSGVAEKYDLLLCNLPYVPDSHVINEAARHEPSMAIFGGPDGLDLYRRLFAQASSQHILTEALPPQHEELAAIASSWGYTLVKTDDFIQLYQRTVNTSV